jgi:geranylgeranyl pyrophosphate synthase
MKEIADCGALTDSLDIALGYVDRGIEALSTLPESDGRKALEVLGRYLVERSR